MPYGQEVGNHVPDDLFDIALTTPRPPRVPLFDFAPAYHLRRVPQSEERPPESRLVVETWAVKGVGRRREERVGPNLRKLSVDTGRWLFFWDVEQNRVIASPTRLADPKRAAHEDMALINERADVIRGYEELTAVFACHKEQLADEEAEKVTAYFPAESWNDARANSNIHDFDPRHQRMTLGTEHRSRRCWFDPETGLQVQFRCGCQPPGKQMKVDYPAPESVPWKLFKFQVPAGARLEVIDSELSRPIYSEGSSTPNLKTCLELLEPELGRSICSEGQVEPDLRR